MTKSYRSLLVVFLLILILGTFRIELTLAQGPCGDTYVVLPGDTLARIADKCGVTEQAILDLNPEINDPTQIYVGQVLKLPDPTIAIPPQIAISPLCGDPGTLISILGSGFPEDSPVQISIGQRGQPSIEIGNILSNQFGRIETTITIPSSAIPEKSWLVYAESLTGIPVVKGISTDFWITGLAPDPNSSTTYVVQPGDTLESIAAKFYRTVRVLLSANPQINNNQVFKGQLLVIPAQDEFYPATSVLPECGPAGNSIQVIGWEFPSSTLVNLKIGEFLQPGIPSGNTYVNPDKSFQATLLIPLSAEASEDWVVTAEAFGPPFVRSVSNVYSVTPPTDPNAAKIYFVRPGDTLNQIAVASQRTVTSILEVNPQISNPNQLMVNEKLLIPRLDPTIIISPSSGPPFTVVTILGVAYPANARIEIGVSKVGADPQYVGIVTTGSAGMFSSEGIIPGTARIGERWIFYTRYALANGALITLKSSEFIIASPRSVLEPYLTIWPTSGPPGTTMYVVTNNFPPLTQVNLELVKTGAAPLSILSTWADIKGSFATELIIPETSQEGDTWTVTVEVTNDPNITATSEPFTVTVP
jgi:LysM repeat protein